MATYYRQSGIVWDVPSGSYVLLQRPAGGPHDTSQSVPVAISDDGSTIVGYVVEADFGAQHSARWDSSGNLTILPSVISPTTGGQLVPGDLSSDGTIITAAGF